jgi:hypothetical protein
MEKAHDVHDGLAALAIPDQETPELIAVGERDLRKAQMS